MSQAPSPGAVARAFTLIELLVVVSIIAVLASMLLPALGRARQAAYGSACMSNLKQVQTGNALFAEEHDGYLAPCYGPLPPGGGSDLTGVVRTDTQWNHSWFDLLAYSNRYVAREVFRCPADRMAQDWGRTSIWANREFGSSSDHADWPISYGYSGQLGAYGNWIWSHPTWVSLVGAKRAEDFSAKSGRPNTDPTRAIVIFDFDNMDLGAAGGGDNSKYVGGFSFGVERMSSRHSGGRDYHANRAFRPSGATTAAFVDGHAEMVNAPFGLSTFAVFSNFAARYDFAGNFER